MAAWVNKWFSFSGIAAILLLASSNNPLLEAKTLIENGRSFHPIHISVVEINHNSSDKSLEISCKIFTDDFERILAKNYKTKTDLTNPTNKAAMDTLIKKYLFSHLTIKVNGKPVNFSYLGWENEDAATYGYIEALQVPSASKIEIVNSIMYDQFEDQANIIHVIVGVNRKSSRLTYPNKEASFNF